MEISESRKAADDTRHRIPYPNSRSRAIKLIGLGDGGGRIADAITERGMRHVQAIAAGSAGREGGSAGMLQAMVDENDEIGRAIRSADMVFVVARDGDNVALAPAVGQMAHQKGVLVTGILIHAETAGAVSDATLNALRGACDMLVMVGDDQYVGEMLAALGA